MSTTTRPTTVVNAAPRSRRVPTVVDELTGSAAEATWRRYIAAHPQATVFHDPHWCAAVAEVFGHRPCHLQATRRGRVVGLLPLMQVDSLLAGRLLISVPYGTYGGVLADDAAAAAELGAAAADLARQRQARVLELRSATAQVPTLDDVPGYVGFVRSLPLHPNDVPAFLPKRARAAARHARDRDGVTVQHDARQLATVWQLYCRSMRRIASISYPLRFFKALARRFGTRCWVTVAAQGDRPLCGTLSLVFRDTLMPYVLGADDRVHVDGAANLLYWSVMERAVRSGLHTFDYGRSRADNAGAMGFKKNQGFEPQPLGYQRYVPPGQSAPDLKPTNPRFAAARALWPHLPLGVTRALGAWLSGSLPG